ALLADTPPANDEASDGLSDTARARVARAFARGAGHALLDLGATELDAPLTPPLAFLRDLGRAFVTRLCALPDLDERRERTEVDCPPDERARLAGAVPPMDGGEYVDADWVAARWADLNRAFADEIRAHRGPVAEWLRAHHPSWHAVGKVCLHLAENRGDEAHPFAFLATYEARAGAGGKVQHRPLARAVEESSARGDREALLHLSVAVALGDEKLTAAEVRQLMASSDGLVRLRGQWVELDRERLRQVLDHWERVRDQASEGGLSFLEGMRLLAGAARTKDDAAALAAGEGWSRVEAGAWMARTLEGLRGPTGLAAADPVAGHADGASLRHAGARAGRAGRRRYGRHRSRHHHLRNTGARGGAPEPRVVAGDPGRGAGDQEPRSATDAGGQGAEGPRPHRADRHASREPPRRSLVDLRLPRSGPAGLGARVLRVRQEAGRSPGRELRPAAQTDPALSPAPPQERPLDRG